MHLLEVYFEVPLLIVFLKRGYFKVNYIVGKLKWCTPSFRPISAWGSTETSTIRKTHPTLHVALFTRVYAYLVFWYSRQWSIMHEEYSRNLIFVVMENFPWIKKIPYPRDQRGQAIMEVVEIKSIPWVTDIFQIDIKFVVAWFRKCCSLTNPITSIWILAFKMPHSYLNPFDLDSQNTWNQILTWVIVSYWERFAKGI